MIRVLHCVATLDRGGYETLIMNVYRKIDRTKIQFDFLYSFDGVYNEEITKLGGNIYKIPFITQVGPFKYRKLVDNFFNTHKEYSIVHSHMDKFSGLIMELAKKNNIPIRIAHSHNTKNEGGVIYSIVKNYYGKKIHYATDKLACGKEAGEWLFGKGKQFLVIKNGIDLDRFKPIDNRDPKDFVVVDVARFYHQKNHMFLLTVFKELLTINKNSKLILAGEGPLEYEIREKCKELMISENVCLLGDIENVANLLTKCDVFVSTSIFEGLPLSVIEAQAAGLNCILSNKIPKEVDITNTCKFLSIDESPKKWAKEIINFKGKSKNKNANKIIESGYDINSTVKFLEDFYYRRLLEKQ